MSLFVETWWQGLASLSPAKPNPDLYLTKGWDFSRKFPFQVSGNQKNQQNQQKPETILPFCWWCDHWHTTKVSIYTIFVFTTVCTHVFATRFQFYFNFCLQSHGIHWNPVPVTDVLLTIIPTSWISRLSRAFTFTLLLLWFVWHCSHQHAIQLVLLTV